MKKIFHLACFAFILLAAACSDEKEVTLEYNKIDGLLSQCNELLSSSSEGEDLGDFVTGSKAIFESIFHERKKLNNQTIECYRKYTS